MNAVTLSPATALIALGSNLGDSAALIRQAFDKLQEFSELPIRKSSLWPTAPVDCPPGSPPFVNAAVALTPRSGETADSLVMKLFTLEWDLGRRPKTVMNEARPIDLDLIAFGAEVRDRPTLILPHPRAHLRWFVLQPLSEVAPDFVLPGQSATIRELLQSLPSN